LLLVTDVNKVIETVWRMEAAKIIASLSRMVRDVGVAEELASGALVAALEQWPRDGVPDKPAAWLMATAKHRALDHLRRNTMLAKKHEQIAHEPEKETPEKDLDVDINDDLLRLIFTACHPVLSSEARVALTLRMLGGLTPEEIARAFLSTTTTIQQRIVRAKKALADANVPFELPRGEERAQRLSSVLEVIYLIFNEGYSATAGDDWMRPALCEDALRLGRTLAALMPEEPEVHGLVALMEIQASRTRARTDAQGNAVLLLDQNRALWNQLLIRRGLAALDKALASGTAGPYTMQAAIAACHARARTAGETDWQRIAALYAQLAEMTPSPIIELNRAVAVSMACGPAEGLKIVDAIASDLEGYHLLASVRGDLLMKLGRVDEARAEFEKAASLTKNAREREMMLARARNA
jgi:RNA polymerase sigma-70 factor, ECF subfamily